MRTLTKKILSACALTLATLATNAQVASLYTFSAFQGSYTAVTGGTAWVTSAFDDEDIYDPTSSPNTNPNTGQGLNIGFNFVFDNITYDRLAISNNGWISLGQSSLGTGAVNTNCTQWSHPISTGSSASAALQHKIAPFATDLLGKSTGSEIRIQTLGTSPTRTTVVQWSNYQDYSSAPTNSDNINFQLKLYETTNIVDAIYGTIYCVTLDTNAEVGLRGGSNADYNNRKIIHGTNTWTNSVPGTANTSVCWYSTTLTPTSGQVYRWSPAQCASLSALTATATAALICPTKTVNISLAPNFTVSGVSYSWTSSTNSATGPFTAMPNGSLPVQNQTMTTTTWYQLTALCLTDNSTVTSSVYNVSVSPLPSVTAVASTASLCSGTSLTLTGVGNATAYVWTGGYPNGVGFNASTTTTFVVTGTSVDGCTASAVVPVTVVPTPSLLPTASPTAMCIGTTSTLTAVGAVSYTWASATQTVFTPTLSVTPTSTGISTYTISRNNLGCLNTQQLSIVTYSIPTIFALASPTLVCASKPTTLAVAGGVSYTWTSPGMPPSIPSFTFGGASPVVFPPVSSIYTVTAHDGTCANTTTVEVHADPNPTITTSATPPVICSGENATINASGGLNYTITSSNSTATLTSLPISQVFTASASYIIVGDNSFGCTTTANQVLIVNPNPVMTASVVANKTLVCSGGTVALKAGGADTYSWSSGALTQSTIVNPVNIISGAVIYTVTGTFTATTCHTDKTVSVSVFIPTITVTGNTSTCFGGNINLTAGGGTGGNNYRWYTVVGGPATSSISSISNTINAPAIYTITALTTSATAVLCPSSKTVEVNIFFNPTITAVAQRTPICIKESVVLTGNGGDTYLWNTGGNTQTISVSPNVNTNYTVTGTDINGCVSTATLQVKVSSCTGIATNAANIGLNVYPNPSNGEFVIQSSTELHLTLINDLGQYIRTIDLSGANSYNISVSDLAKGIYFLTGQKDNSQISQKIVVIK